MKTKAKENHNIILITIALLLVVILLTAGYAAFSDQFTITNSVAHVRVEKVVRINGVATNSEKVTNLDYSSKNILSTVYIPAGSSITYSVTATNLGNVPVAVSAVSFVSGSGNLSDLSTNISSTNYIKICDEEICTGGVSKTFEITITNNGSTDINTDLNTELTFSEMYTIYFNNKNIGEALENYDFTYRFTTTPPTKISLVSGTSATYNYENNTLTVISVKSDMIFAAADDNNGLIVSISADMNNSSGYTENIIAKNDKELSLDINLENQNSYVNYTMELTNITQDTIRYTGLTVADTSYSNNDIVINVKGIDDQKTFTLAPGENKTITLELKYANDVNNPSNTNLNGNIEFGFEKVENTYQTYQSGNIEVVDVIYYDPINNHSCTQQQYSTSNSVLGANSGCLKWYVLETSNSNTSYVKLLLDHNLKYSAWTASTTSGPSTALPELNSMTDRWRTLAPSNENHTAYNRTYTIDYSSAKAKFATLEEIANAIGAPRISISTIIYLDTGTNKKKQNKVPYKYGWIYDRTATNCLTYGCLNNATNDSVTTSASGTQNNGYWTADGFSNKSNIVWINPMSASLDQKSYAYKGGIRPVIIVDKSRISNSYKVA